VEKYKYIYMTVNNVFVLVVQRFTTTWPTGGRVGVLFSSSLKVLESGTGTGPIVTAVCIQVVTKKDFRNPVKLVCETLITRMVHSEKEMRIRVYLQKLPAQFPTIKLPFLAALCT
jgi:hypothetical protein